MLFSARDQSLHDVNSSGTGSNSRRIIGTGTRLNIICQVCSLTVRECHEH
jgi:hypothetical protein